MAEKFTQLVDHLLLLAVFAIFVYGLCCVIRLAYRKAYWLFSEERIWLRNWERRKVEFEAEEREFMARLSRPARRAWFRQRAGNSMHGWWLWPVIGMAAAFLSAWWGLV